MGFSSARVDGRRERDGGMVGCTGASGEEETWSVALGPAPPFPLDSDEMTPVTVGESGSRL